MSTSNSTKKGNDYDEKCNASYIELCYVDVVHITGFVLGVVMVLSFFIIGHCSDDYQKYIVLFTDVFCALLFVISLIAMFREVSRLHAREFPLDTINRVNKLQNELNELKNKRIANIETDLNELKNCKVNVLEKVLTELREKRIANIETDLNELKNSKVNALEKDLTKLKDNKIANIETDLNELKNSKVIVLEKDLNELRNIKIANIEKVLNELRGIKESH